MKKILPKLVLFILLSQTSLFIKAQNWTWISGTPNNILAPVWGTKGVFSAGNTPGSRYGSATWIDNTTGNLWLYGGHNSTLNAFYGDLWQYDVIIKQWAWMSGAGFSNPGAAFGTLGVPSVTNFPGALTYVKGCVDNAGDFWLFGGANATSSSQNFNNLWKYVKSTNQWVWMKGAGSSQNVIGNYGTLGVANVTNTPGSRYGNAIYADKNNNIWIFGGSGNALTAGSANTGYLNDLWRYNISSGNWTWMKGTNTLGNLGVAGSFGIPSSTIYPSGRYHFQFCADTGATKLYLTGGFISGPISNAIWEYNTLTNNFTWLSGTLGNAGATIFGNLGIENSTNNIDNIFYGSTYIDKYNRINIFGGNYTTPSVQKYNAILRYNTVTNNWTWHAGTSNPNDAGNLGTLNVPSPNNNPRARTFASVWYNKFNNKVYVFGGVKASVGNTGDEMMVFDNCNSLQGYANQSICTPTSGVFQPTVGITGGPVIKVYSTISGGTYFGTGQLVPTNTLIVGTTATCTTYYVNDTTCPLNVRKPVTLVFNSAQAPGPSFYTNVSPSYICNGASVTFTAVPFQGTNRVGGFIGPYNLTNSVQKFFNSNTGSIDVSNMPDSLVLMGPATNTTGSLGYTQYSFKATTNGVLRFNWSWTCTDGSSVDYPTIAVNAGTATPTFSNLNGYVVSSASLTQSGTYIININNGDSIRFRVTSVDNFGTAGRLGISGFVCSGTMPNNFSWFTTAIGGSPFGSGLSIPFTPTTTSMSQQSPYFVELLTGMGCKSPSRATQSFYCFPNTTGTITATSNSVCAGNSVTLSLTSSNPSYINTANWYVPPSALTATFTNTLVITPSVAGTYSAYGFSSGFGTPFPGTIPSCTYVASKTIGIYPNPTITVLNGTICPGGSYTITPGGASTYSYSIGPVLNPTVYTTYSVTGTSAMGCIGSNTAVGAVSIGTNITVSANSGTICQGTSFNLVPFGASTYSYSGGIGPVVSPTATTIYTVTGQSGSCVNTTTAQVNVLGVRAPTICLVTVDSLGNNNEIFWEKTAYLEADSFIVYRENLPNVYTAIARISKNDFSSYADTNRSIGPINGDPNFSFYKYKLQLRDTCGNYSALSGSPWHQSIKITDLQTGTFNWNYYATENGGTLTSALYTIWRQNIISGVSTTVGATTGNTGNDSQYSTLAVSGNVKWFITTSGFVCNPSLKVNNSLVLKSRTKSNQCNEKQFPAQSVLEQKLNTQSIAIYPNPTNNKIIIDARAIQGLDYSIEITNAVGQLLYSKKINQQSIPNYEMDLIDFEKGIYFINFIYKGKIISAKKVIKL